MNSKQRRKAKKLYRHIVILRPRNGQRYFQHDEHVHNGRIWCRKNFKKDSWRFKEGWDQAEFKFTNEQDAVYFALKWS